MAASAPTQIPPVYRRRIGDILVTAVSDGTLERTHEMMIGVSAEESAQRLKEACRPAIVISVNAFVIETAGRIALIETGSGNYLGPSAGHQLRNLTLAGFPASEIEAILLTHMHPDHSAGLTDLSTGCAHYAKAELVVHANEPKHWFDDAAMARGTEREKKLFFQQAREQTKPYLNRMRTFEKGEVFPGITAIPCPGHTPGHTAYMISSGNEQLLIWGDTVHIPEVQVPRPEVSMVVDSDPAMAAATRRKVFDMAATDRLLVTGMHLHFPGFGFVARRGEGYAYVPEPWQQTFR